MELTRNMLALVQCLLVAAYRRREPAVIAHLTRLEDYLIRRYTR